MDRLKLFIEGKQAEEFLRDLHEDAANSQVESHVIRNQGGHKTKSAKKVTKGSEEEKIEKLKQRIKSEQETLFFLVIDECHYAPVKGNIVDELINSDVVSNAPNLIQLQVSATPYSFVTKNSRIRPENIVDMVAEMTDDRESTLKSYWGIWKFIETTSEDDKQDPLKPGIMSKDKHFERSIEERSDLEEYIKEKFKDTGQEGEKNRKKGQKRLQTKVEHLTRLYGLIFQYCAAMLKKAGINPNKLKSQIAHLMNDSKITTSMLKEIDSGPNGEGSMILVRVVEKEDGRAFGKLLTKLRNALHQENQFSIVLDIDEGNAASKLYEEAFLPRLQWWNAEGDRQYRPSSYKDLLHLPIILVVVERGKYKPEIISRHHTIQMTNLSFTFQVKWVSHTLSLYGSTTYECATPRQIQPQDVPSSRTLGALAGEFICSDRSSKIYCKWIIN